MSCTASSRFRTATLFQVNPRTVRRFIKLKRVTGTLESRVSTGRTKKFGLWQVVWASEKMSCIWLGNSMLKPPGVRLPAR